MPMPSTRRCRWLRETEPRATPAPIDWATPRPFALPDLGPGVAGELHTVLEAALCQIAADPSVQALVILGSRPRGTARQDSDLDLLVVERTPHLAGEDKVASWWHHFQPLNALRLPGDLVVSGSAAAARLAGSRWHVISEAARHGQVLVGRHGPTSGGKAAQDPDRVAGQTAAAHPHAQRVGGVGRRGTRSRASCAAALRPGGTP